MTTKRKRPYRPRDPSVNSAVMASIRSKNNLAEVTLRKKLWQKGLRYRLYVTDLPGRPDIVFRSAEVAVFVDGDFWHGRILLERGEPALRATFKKRRAWWVEKITCNAQRDAEVTAALEGFGWTVLRLWEKDVLRNPDKAARRVAKVVERSRRSRID